MKTIEQILGENIRTLREEMDLSQIALGKLLKVSGHTISMWENAKQPIRQANLKAIANAFSCTKEDLYKDRSTSPTENLTVDHLLRTIKAQEKKITELARQVNESRQILKAIPADILKHISSIDDDGWELFRTQTIKAQEKLTKQKA